MNDDSWLLWLVLALVFLWFGWLDESEIRFRLQYGAEISLDTKPHDCEFLAAPLGKKYCAYEPQLHRVVMYSMDKESGEPIISYDEGETWAWNPGGPKETKKIAFMTWEKTYE